MATTTNCNLVVTINQAVTSPAITITHQDGHVVESFEWIPKGGDYYSVNLGGLSWVNFVLIEIDSTHGQPLKAYLNGETTSCIPIETIMLLTAGNSDSDGRQRITSLELQNESETTDARVKVTYSGKKG